MRRHLIARLSADARTAFELAKTVALRSALTIPAHTPSVLLDLQKDVRQRTRENLAIPFGLAGYRVFVRAHLDRETVAFAHHVPWHPTMRLLWTTPLSARPDLCLVDETTGPVGRDDGSKWVEVRYDYRPGMQPEPGHHVLPILMHPQIYLQYRGHDRLADLRRATRTFRLVFAGHSNMRYEKPIFSDLYGMLSRYAIVEHFRKLPDVTAVSSEEELRLQEEHGNATALLVNSDQIRINQERWLDFVASSDFFLCPPGTLYPPSHNAVEAMAVGTIPLINYPDWFFPPLRHGINCVRFDTLGSLDEAVQEILDMGQDRLAELKQGAIEYYEEHLSPVRFTERLAGDPAGHIVLHALDGNERRLRAALNAG
jgi:hypothetical protein